MRIFKNLVLPAMVLVAAISVRAADMDTTTVPMTAQSMLKRGEVSTTVRMEYCLRNVPELTEALVVAHANYARAFAEAAQILERDFPASRYTSQRFRVRSSKQDAAADDLKRAHSEGFHRVCPNLGIYMRRATGESLAKEVGDVLIWAQERFGE